MFRTVLTWWFIVEPWEQAVRVRFGKNPRLFTAGVHFRIPYFDALYKQNTRRRVSAIPVQTLTTDDNKTLTLHGSVGYQIDDVMRLQMTLHNAEQAIKQEISGLMSKYVTTHVLADCGPAKVTEYVAKNQRLAMYGLGGVDFFLTGFVSDLPTFRLIQDALQPYIHTYDEPRLNTVAPATTPAL